MQVGRVGRGWLVYGLTGSAFALGWVSASWSVSNSILSPWGGVISDRIEKRTLLIWVRGVMVVAAFAVATLVALDAIQVWHLAVYSLFRGILFAILMPAQNAYLAQLVDRKTLLNAVALNSVGMGLSRVIFSYVAGYLVDAFGVASAFFTVALLYLIVFITLFKLPPSGTTDPGDRSVWADLVDGVKYIKTCPLLIPLLALVFARGFLGMPYRTLMPKYADDVMGLDASGLGALLAAPGWGSLISSFVLASLGDVQRKGRILIISGVVMGLGLVLFGSAHVYWIAFAALVLVGAAGNLCMVSNRTLLQLSCEAPYLGRVMSAYMMMFGMTQLGTMPAGAIADRFGVSLVITVQGILFALTFVIVWVTQPKLRELQ
jgi:MFS family permease